LAKTREKATGVSRSCPAFAAQLQLEAGSRLKRCAKARPAEQLPGINFTQFAALLIAADTGRGDSWVASLKRD
jgi:hypothetical protein